MNSVLFVQELPILTGYASALDMEQTERVKKVYRKGETLSIVSHIYFCVVNVVAKGG